MSTIEVTLLVAVVVLTVAFVAVIALSWYNRDRIQMRHKIRKLSSSPAVLSGRPVMPPNRTVSNFH